jgi:hypothetical protein
MQATQPKTETRKRLATALAMALAVFAVSTYVGWFVATPRFSKQQLATAFMLQAIQSAVTSYLSVFEENPHSLGDLRIVSPGLFERPNRDEILDGWGQPFHTEFHEDSWLVLSYGRDGQPGGAGLDADISNLSASSQEYWPTFFQFLLELNPRFILILAFITSVVAFVFAYFAFPAPRFDFRGVLRLCFGLAFLLLFTQAFAGCLALVAQDDVPEVRQ